MMLAEKLFVFENRHVFEQQKSVQFFRASALGESYLHKLLGFLAFIG